MNKLIGLFAIILLVGLTSCSDDKEGTTLLNINTVVGGSPMVIFNAEYPYVDDQRISITKVDFYISDVTFVAEDGTAQVVEDIDFVDFSGAVDQTASENGVDVGSYTLPTGDYNTLRFSIGVPQEMNAKADTDFDPGHPLARSSHYWAGWESFIFAKLEGYMNEPDSAQVGLSFHTGSDGLFRTIELPIDLTVTDGDQSTVNLEFDVMKLFNHDGTMLDFHVHRGVHTDSDLVVAGKIVDQYERAFTVK